MVRPTVAQREGRWQLRYFSMHTIRTMLLQDVVRLYVSVAIQYSVKTAKHMVELHSRLIAPNLQFSIH